ncbi:MAG: SGNH/GDSL hydrolase family protein [Desulfatiglandaceae bacterium]
MREKKSFCASTLFLLFLSIGFVSAAAATTRIMPLGDSITQGETSGEPNPDRQVSYRKALGEKLLAAGYDIDFVGSLNSGSDILGLKAADHEGWPGYEADQVRDEVFDWLQLNPPDVVLLHIGTNDISGSQPVADIVAEVEEILDEIFIYSTEITVILARIINRSTFSQDTNDFNNLLPGMVNAHPSKDKILIVDMEAGAGIDYDLWPAGDMNDPIHPYQNPISGTAPGYEKMANVWFSALQDVLPDPDPPAADNKDDDDDSGCFISAAANGSF